MHEEKRSGRQGNSKGRKRRERKKTKGLERTSREAPRVLVREGVGLGRGVLVWLIC